MTKIYGGKLMTKQKTTQMRKTAQTSSKSKEVRMKSIDPAIASRLKDTLEQQIVVGPIVQYLVDQGWHLEQIVFGKKEWLVPKSPSEQTKREKCSSFNGFPVDIAIFDSTKTVGDPRHILFVIECKQPDEQAGVSQLEAYFVGEPHARLGVWANNAEPSASGAFIYRNTDGRILLKRRHIADLPQPGEAIEPEAQRISFNDLIAPTGY
jgi:type I restriction enzyme M protein